MAKIFLDVSILVDMTNLWHPVAFSKEMVVKGTAAVRREGAEKGVVFSIAPIQSPSSMMFRCKIDEASESKELFAIGLCFRNPEKIAIDEVSNESYISMMMAHGKH
jgi:hypothetical protein